MTRIGDFVLGNQISQSEHSEVFVAHKHDQSKEQWLVKLISDLEPMAQVAVQVRNRVLQRQPIPHCITPRFAGPIDGRLVIARSSVAGLSLDILLKDLKERNLAISLETALSPILDILLALSAIHQLSTDLGPMVHGSVFAEHVVIDTNGDALLLNTERGSPDTERPRQHHDIAGCFALFYEILAIANNKPRTASKQKQHDKLRAALDPIILSGLQLPHSDAKATSASLLDQILSILKNLEMAPNRSTWASWVKNAGGAIPAQGPAAREVLVNLTVAATAKSIENNTDSAPAEVLVGKLIDEDPRPAETQTISTAPKAPVHQDLAKAHPPILPGNPVQKFEPTTPQNTVTNTTGVSGRLIDMPLSEIVQTMEFSRKTATVIVSDHNGWSGDLSFSAGKVVYAKTANDEGEAAFFQLVIQKDGMFRIRYGEVKEPANIDNTTTFLLLEAMRRQDESNN